MAISSSTTSDVATSTQDTDFSNKTRTAANTNSDVLFGLKMAIGESAASKNSEHPTTEAPTKAKAKSTYSHPVNYISGLKEVIESQQTESGRNKEKWDKTGSKREERKSSQTTSVSKPIDSPLSESDGDEIDILASFMTFDRKVAKPKLETRKRKISEAPVLIIKEEAPGFDKLVFMMNDFLTSAGYQEEKEVIFFVFFFYIF